MTPNLEELRTHVAGLSDVALLEVRPEDLTESAREVYEQELESRGLSWNVDATDVDGAAAPGASLQDLVTVATFESVEEARFARTMIENEGIPVWFIGELTPERMTADALSGLELVTKPEFLEQAQSLLQSEISEEELARQAEEAGPAEEIEEEMLEEDRLAEEEAEEQESASS